MFLRFVSLRAAVLRLAVFSLTVSLPFFFFFFLTFRFPARHLLLITSNLHPGRDENSDIHTARERTMSMIYSFPNQKKKKKEGGLKGR